MHEDTRSSTLRKILKTADDEQASFGKERQHTAQAHTLHVEWKDGRESDTFSWVPFVRAHWKDDGHIERLLVLFADSAIEIEGHNLKPLENEIREGKLNSIREMSSARQSLLKNTNPDGEPIISAIRSFPDVDEMLRDIKGETANGKSGHAGRLQR